MGCMRGSGWGNPENCDGRAPGPVVRLQGRAGFDQGAAEMMPTCLPGGSLQQQGRNARTHRVLL